MANSSSTHRSTFIHMILLAITLFQFYHTSEATVCKKTSHLPTEKPKVILVHGFTGGAWNWYKVRWRLESLGYTVMAPDLKASGMDKTDISKIDTFEQYNEPLDHIMGSLPKHEKVVLVGHSCGGVSLMKSIHDYPDKIHVAVFVCATMLKNGYLTCEDLQIGVPHFGDSKCNASCPTFPNPSCFDKALSLTSAVDLSPLVNRTVDSALGNSLGRPGPYRAVLGANFTSKGSASSIENVPRVYVKTAFDQTLTPKQQDRMLQLWPPCEVYVLSNDHDVPYTKPAILVSLIINATSYASGD